MNNVFDGADDDMKFMRYIDRILALDHRSNWIDANAKCVACNGLCAKSSNCSILSEGRIDIEMESDQCIKHTDTIYLSDAKVLKFLVCKRLNMILGLRMIEEFCDVTPDEDNVEMNKINTDDIKHRMHIKEWETRSVFSDRYFYECVGRGAYVTGSRDDNWMYESDQIDAMLMRKECMMLYRYRYVLKMMSDEVCSSGFTGVVMIDTSSMTLHIPTKDINIGLSSGEIQSGVNGSFSICLSGLNGSGMQVQNVRLESMYRRDNFDVRFEYHRILTVGGREDMMEWYIENKNVSLDEMFDEIACVSGRIDLDKNCLIFVESKASLLFGETDVSLGVIGRSVLFYLRKFGGEALSVIVNKMIEYIEEVIGTLGVCQRHAEGLLFLHDTCIFVNRAIAMESRFGRRMSSVIRLDGLCDNVSRDELCRWVVDNSQKGFYVASAYMKDSGACKFIRVFDDGWSMKCKSVEIESRLIMHNSIGKYLTDYLLKAETTHGHRRSLMFNKLSSIYAGLRRIYTRGLIGCVSDEKVGKMISCIIGNEKPRSNEVVPLCTILHDICKMIPVRISVLDKALVECAVHVATVFGKNLRRYMRNGKGDIEGIFERMSRLYVRFDGLESAIHKDVFSSEVHCVIEDECRYRLGKISCNVNSGLKQLVLCRNVYERHLSFLEIAGLEANSVYCEEERKVLMRFYDMMRIRKAFKDGDTLRREICRMLGKVVGVEENVRNRYRLYLYECIVDNAKDIPKEDYQKVMMMVNECFL
ncbi:hypothetical protein M896_060660 [Ordospora colligata OC4]|uniref:Uncharacterized protein n=1 Tax=Ordospora colligata OC4 TaxID=1354746 RepID=A0A0B2UKJ8_9MICR|nr:uncharacterized protein M896_060660 [Ordospora colligata OC4]KHN69567.1 hypothetical protein M896_060660 [Ordospora colligata OC4]